jgi:hypothetical protein
MSAGRRRTAPPGTVRPWNDAHNGVIIMRLQMDLARERTRSHLLLAEELRVTSGLRALHRARRAEHKAERRLLEAWQARDDLESVLSTK